MDIQGYPELYQLSNIYHITMKWHELIKAHRQKLVFLSFEITQHFIKEVFKLV